MEILTQELTLPLVTARWLCRFCRMYSRWSGCRSFSEVPLDKTISDEDYKKELKQLRQRLGELHNRLYRKKVPVVIAYEGWDAAGKGGNIKRITSALDPRGYEVHPIASPSPMKRRGIICGVSGQDCRKPVTLPFLTGPGTDV